MFFHFDPHNVRFLNSAKKKFIYNGLNIEFSVAKRKANNKFGCRLSQNFHKFDVNEILILKLLKRVRQ